MSNLVKKLRLIIIIAPLSCFAQEAIELDIMVAFYTNTHHARTFTSRARIWNLLDNRLILVAGIGGKDSDTISILNSEMLSIIKLIKKHNLNRSINKTYDKNFTSRHGMTGAIQGRIKLDGNEKKFHLRFNKRDAMNRVLLAKMFLKLENELELIYRKHKNF